MMMDNIINVLENEFSLKDHKVYAEINLGALKRNYNRIEKLVRSKGFAKVVPVIKADAYGHGAVKSMEALKSCGADIFAVSSVFEAIELANVKKDADILILGSSLPSDTDELLKHDIIQTVYSLEYAKALNSACHGKKLRVHIKLDTGMNRLGFDAKSTDKTAEEIAEVTKLENLAVQGIFTHFACADEPANENTALQLSRFENVINKLSEKGVDFKIKHVCNSAGILREDIPLYDAVRAGIILYGLMPSGSFSYNEFENVMSLKTKISHIHEIDKGDTVSYGADFVADKKMKIATLPIGYGDGFIRAYSGATVKINGKPCKIIGRICMDQCMIDVTGLDAKPGDEVVIFDKSEEIDTLAKLAGTINYEVVCLVSKRVPRVYTE